MPSKGQARRSTRGAKPSSGPDHSSTGAYDEPSTTAAPASASAGAGGGSKSKRGAKARTGSYQYDEPKSAGGGGGGGRGSKQGRSYTSRRGICADELLDDENILHADHHYHLLN